MKKPLEFWSNDRFKHNWIDHNHTIEQVNPPDGSRYYLVDNQHKFPSVTSVLGAKSNDFLDSWRANVGEEEARKVSNRASSRGSLLHENAENYLLNHRVQIDSRGLFNVQMFKSIIPLLDRIQNIVLLEDPVFSKVFSVAGTVDCIAEFDGQLSIIDFKTSRRIKTIDDIESYWIQTSVYSYAFEEMTGIKIPNLVVIMAVENSKPLLFTNNRSAFTQQLVEFRSTAHEITSKRFLQQS
jgi:genome maintenance exonuclease 1